MATYLHFILPGFKKKTCKFRGHTSTGTQKLSWVATYVHFILNDFFFNCQKPHTQKHRHFGRLLRAFLGLLPTNIFINLILNNRQKPQIRKHRHLGGLPKQLSWVATYLHFILTGLSLTAKCRRHISTCI